MSAVFAADEHSFQKKLKEQLELHGAHCPSLVANMMMAGMPDMVVNTSAGYTFYIENKFWRNKNYPQDAHAMQGMLKGPQIAVIKHALWKRDILCPIVAQISFDLETACVCYKDKIFLTKWKEIAKVMARLPDKQSFMTLFT